MQQPIVEHLRVEAPPFGFARAFKPARILLAQRLSNGDPGADGGSHTLSGLGCTRQWARVDGGDASAGQSPTEVPCLPVTKCGERMSGTAV